MLFTGLLALNLAAADRARGDVAAGDFTPSYLGERLGLAQKATIFPGLTVREKGGHKKLGKIEDAVVDLHSGRVLCGLVAIAHGETVAIPSRVFYSADESQAQLALTDVSFDGVPRVKDGGIPGVLASLPETFQHFGRPMFWDSAAPPTARKSRDFIGLNVRNEAGESLGQIVNLMIDLPTGRVVYVIVSLSGKSMADLYAVPPKAFRDSPNKDGLLLKMPQDKIAGIAQSDGFFWSNMAEPAWGANVYRMFGQHADFDASAPALVQSIQPVAAVEITKHAPVKGDREIMEEILAAMMHDSTSDPLIFKHAEMKPVHGRVILTGWIKNEQQRFKLISIVGGVVGATNIDDQLRIK